MDNGHEQREEIINRHVGQRVSLTPAEAWRLAVECFNAGENLGWANATEHFKQQTKETK